MYGRRAAREGPALKPKLTNLWLLTFDGKLVYNSRQPALNGGKLKLGKFPDASTRLTGAFL